MGNPLSLRKKACYNVPSVKKSKEDHDMETPLIADYYRETNPVKRRRILEKAIAERRNGFFSYDFFGR